MVSCQWTKRGMVDFWILGLVCSLFLGLLYLTARNPNHPCGVIGFCFIRCFGNGSYYCRFWRYFFPYGIVWLPHNDSQHSAESPSSVFDRRPLFKNFWTETFLFRIFEGNLVV